MSVALVIQHAKCMRRIVINGLSSSTIFFHIISLTNGMIFFLGGGELLNIDFQEKIK